MGMLKTVLCRSARLLPILAVGTVGTGLGVYLAQNYGDKIPNISSEITKFYDTEMNKVAEKIIEKKMEEDNKLPKMTETESTAAAAVLQQ